MVGGRPGPNEFDGLLDNTESIEEEKHVPDLLFVLLTLGLFAALALAVRGVERL